jgi:hypothetical protein
LYFKVDQLLGAPSRIQSSIFCTSVDFNAPVGGIEPDFTSPYIILDVGTTVLIKPPEVIAL